MLHWLVHRTLDLYGLGLLIYVIASFLPGARDWIWLKRLKLCYEPFLVPIRAVLKTLRNQPAEEAKAHPLVDVSPMILLMLILLVQQVARWLLTGP